MHHHRTLVRVRRRPPDLARLLLYSAASLLLLCSRCCDGLDQPGPPSVQYCSPNKPLSTKYFVPFFEAHRGIAEGCASTEKTSEGLELHVVKIDTAAKNVLLSISESSSDVSKGIVLVLQSQSPTGWRLAFVGARPSTFKVVVALSRGSSILTSNVGVSSEMMLDQAGFPRTAASADVLLQLSRSRWGGVTTLSSIRDANRISILMPHPASLPGRCQLVGDDSLLLDSSAAVNAYYVSAQAVQGCFHKEMSGTLASDVHIINLSSADGLPEEPGVDPAPVFLTLAPEETSKGAAPLKRNITLVLHSARPVKWMLQSSALEGTLSVIADKKSAVNDLSLSPSQTLELKTRTLSSEFEALWRTTLDETGIIPVAYVRLEKGNIISVIIPTRSKEDITEVPTRRSHNDQVAQLYESNENDLAEKRVLIPGKVIDQAINHEAEAEEIRALERKVESGLRKKCSQSETIVTIERKVVDKYSVAKMTLNDPVCSAEKNATHWVLKSPSTSCGSLNQFSGKNTMFRNNVVLQFLPSSRFYRKSVQIPFSCRFRPGLPGQDDGGDAVGDDDDEEESSSLDYDDDISATGPWDNDDSDDSDEMYIIRIQRRRQAESTRPQTIIQRRHESANVSPGDELRVLTDFETRSYLNLAIERCWLSSDSSGGENDGGGDGDDFDSKGKKKQQQQLIAGGCAAPNSNVAHFSARGNANPTFTFTVTEEHLAMKRLYLYCLIGLCSPEESLASGNIGICIDPATHCSGLQQQQQQQAAPVAQQLTRRGPLFVHSYNVAAEDDKLVDIEDNDDVDDYAGGRAEVVNHSSSSSSSSRESPGLHSSHVVMVGVPTEIAVAIALASFIIGAGLTGLLCCVHHRKAVPKTLVARTRIAEVHADGSELQSMMNGSAAGAAAAPSSSCAHNNNGHAVGNNSC